MRTIRDLREIINVSRLNYNYDDDINNNNNYSDNELNLDEFNQQQQQQHQQKLLPKPISSNKIPVHKSTSNSDIYNRDKNLAASKEYFLLNRNSIPRLSTNKSIIIEDNTTKKSLALNSRSVFLKDEFDFNGNDNSSKNDSDILVVEGNFDEMLTYIDTSIVSEWLNRSNKNLNDMFNWLESSRCESFIQFSNFWLTKLNDKQRRDLINMEYSIIVDEISQAFMVGFDSEKLTNKDVTNLLRAVFKEYPLTLLSFRGLYLLLDYIDVLCSDRKDDYKKLLSDVKCRTLNKQYAQWLLSIRSFALINLCSAIIKFYLNATTEPTVLDMLRAKSAPANSKRLTTAANRKSTIDIPLVSTSIDVKYKYYKDFVFKYDYVEVLHYLITTKKIDPLKKDEHNRTLIFLAVMNNQPKVLNYLIKRCPKIDINEPCDTGNSPLHAAVNNGKLNIVEILFKSKSLDINLTNKSCMNATALHLSVWHGYDEIAIFLVRNGADPYLKMNMDKNAFEMAKENENEVLAELILEFYDEKKNLKDSLVNKVSDTVNKKKEIVDKK